MTATCYDATNPYPGTAGNSTASFRASSNDPGYLDLSGYAFLAADADQLVAAVKAAINIIREATYSFSQSSIQSSRTADENYHLRGLIPADHGGSVLARTFAAVHHQHRQRPGRRVCRLGRGPRLEGQHDGASRIIKTYKSGSLQDFTMANICEHRINGRPRRAQTNAERDAVVGYIRGESAYNPDNWKLGDVFRSTPITVGDALRVLRRHPGYERPDRVQPAPGRPSPEHKPLSGRLIIVGANDGQLHAFRTSDGSEAWSFIPPNMLSRLKLITHATEPSSLTHQYYVDGPVTVADAWIPGSWSNGKSKSASDWHTLMIFGEGRGAGTNLWSSSASCDSGFNPAYSGPYHQLLRVLCPGSQQ